MSHTPSLQHEANTYFAVTISNDGPYSHDPTTLALAHPALLYISQIGELKDAHLLATPKQENVDDVVLAALRKDEGVTSVEVQFPKQRVKRDEF